MIVNSNIEIKNFYRFIEFTSKLLKIDLSHNRFKSIILDNFRAETKKEIKVKQFSEAYLYLINNINQSLTTLTIKKAYYLLTNSMLKEEKCKRILNTFYRNFDRTPHDLASLIHFIVLDSVGRRKIEFAFMMSNFIMLKKERYPLIPYRFMDDAYYNAIKNKNINKLMMIFIEIESKYKKSCQMINLSFTEVIQKIKSCIELLKIKYKVEKLYLYGSYAKQEVLSSSDLDLLVIFDKELINLEKNDIIKQLKQYLSENLQMTVDLLDFTQAMEKLDISEMENIITLI